MIKTHKYLNKTNFLILFNKTINLIVALHKQLIRLNS